MSTRRGPSREPTPTFPCSTRTREMTPSKVPRNDQLYYSFSLALLILVVAGYEEERSLLMSQKSLEKRFGQSAIFIASTFMERGGLPPSTNPASLLKEAIHVISCGYEDKTEWGKEVSELIAVSHYHRHPSMLYLTRMW